MAEGDARPRPFSLSLSGWILVALVLGIACGLFFGERVAFLRGLADAFIRLLQMAVLPYVVVSLVAGLGSLSYREVGFVARQGGLILLALWGITLAVLLCLPLAYPDWESASFFSTAMVEPPGSFDFVSLYIPDNPFRSMAENSVPAVVLFCIALGVALVGVAGREPLIENLQVLGRALSRVTSFVVFLTPIGVFAIAASAAGTMTIEDFERLQVHVATYVAVALLLGLWLMPGLVSAVTDIRYRDVIRLSRDAIVTGFTTGNLFVILPLLSEAAKELVESAGGEGDEDSAVVDVIVPVSFNFPHAGKLSAIGFVLFAGWYSGTSVSLAEYPTLAVTGLFSLFGSVNVAVPFLLDLLRIPADMFQLFVAVGVVNARFATLVAAMHILVLAVLGACAVSGRVSFQGPRLLRYLIVSVLLAVLVLGGMRAVLAYALDATYHKFELITARSLSGEPVPATVRETAPLDMAPRRPEGSRVDRIFRRGVLRVGFGAGDDEPSADETSRRHIRSLPFAYFNDAGDLVGLDIDMAHALARDLGVEIEFVPFDFWKLAEHLAADHFDIAMTGVPIGARGTAGVAFSESYMDVTLGFVVRDHERGKFATVDSIRGIDGLRIATGRSPYFQQRIHQLFPAAELVEVGSLEDVLEGRVDVDAAAIGAEMGSAWTLLYPQYAVVVPQPVAFSVPVAYPVARGDQDWVNLLSYWIMLKKRDGTVDRLYRYWILGLDEDRREPRWSVIRDVLHWAD